MIRECIIKFDDEKEDIMGGHPLAEKPQELIRCKDCKMNSGYGSGIYATAPMCYTTGARHTDNYFCADAKPAVLCKDCAHSGTFDCPPCYGGKDGGRVCSVKNCVVDDDYHCPHGITKSEAIDI